MDGDSSRPENTQLRQSFVEQAAPGQGSRYRHNPETGFMALLGLQNFFRTLNDSLISANNSFQKPSPFRTF